MSKSSVTPDQITAKLNQPGPALRSQPADRLPAPTREQAMSLTLDQLRSYDRNPRTQHNPKYDEIKESIKAVGLKQKLTVTQRPGDDRYMISDGGNTRLSILNELYQETGDKRYYHQDCHFVPWQGEINVLAGHLAENDNRGQLSWIERARGIFEAKRMIEEEAGETISQRELTKRLRVLGYTINHSHISKMLYTIEHFLPTLPLTLDAGMGKGQIEKLISYRQFCDECWTRCADFWIAHADDLGEGEPWASNVVDGDFAQAWHEEMAQLDHEGQTEFRWNLVEDRLKGMLNEHTGLHFNPIDMAWKNWFTVRKYARAATEEERNDIWTTVDSELERLRHPQERHLYPPKQEASNDGTSSPRKSSGSPSLPSTSNASDESHQSVGDSGDVDDLTFRDGHTDLDSSPAQSPTERGVPESGGTGESVAMKQMRAQLDQLEQRNAELEAQNQQTPLAPQFGAGGEDDNESLGGLLDTDGLLQEHNPRPTRSPEEQATIAADLTLSPHHETEGHRLLRHWQAKEHGEEAIDFEAAALKSVPLQDGGRISPITDLWHIPTWRRNARDLRMQIGEVVQVLASWAGIDASGSSEVIRLNAREGLGFELDPLEGAPSRRAQLVWQLLAGLEGNIDPVLPSDISLLGELVGSHGDTDVRLPDGLFVRVFWLTRLIRVLRDVLDAEGDS
ncbi:MAG: ParB family protein [Pseudomonadota bacterium]|jgi:ParB family protein of integrating conjugative element (PFGI_1 class)|uniref:ParB family protein n=1 Tax=Salinicola sp. TaxID=1978524 RepID=UPI001DB17D17|nr:ParB family protein [Salinicola sp.]MEC8917625.1 ParB family protein [Pseudomonadota bacterium]MED5501275.1 ParB family protein [Pseudomonadota bacterium]NRB55863.1 ParB N-terminal domain-containing protein [Salinicola sp.]